MKKHLSARLLSWLLVFAMLAGFAVPVNAAGQNAKVTFTQVDNSAVSASLLNKADENAADTQTYADTDVVRVSIILKEQPTIGAGFSVQGIAQNAEAMRYREKLQDRQAAVTASIERAVGGKLDVVWNLTLAANIISANVEYGQIEAIEKVPGVAQVLIETRYEPDVVGREETNDPNMATSGKQIGSAAAWAEGYTGAGSRIAVIDTGIDTSHQSFNAEAFQYSLAYWAGESGLSVEEYLESLNLLDAEEVASVADELNAAIDPTATYVSSKIPYAYNYIDEDYDVIHVNDTKGEHGSHVEGIAAANAFLLKEDGTFVRALDEVGVQGVAPDAQILTMKVFGKNGGAYDSDYMAAIEDAIVLGADSINLSLGSGNPGMSRNSNATYQAILDSLTEAGAVVCMSAGNSGSWVENAKNLGYLYADDVSMQTDGSPGSFTNSLAVASVNNDGATGAYFTVGDNMVVYNETDYTNEPLATLAGEHEYVFIDGMGTEEDWAAVGDALAGKVAFCSRGAISFYQKAEFAAAAGAVATIIYNNQSGVINMDLSSYTKTAPAVSITQAAGAAVKAASTAVTDDEGNVLYYTGTVTVADGVGSAQYNSDYYTMSDFSSWGVPGSLELKPEITAPGGSIYSVNGIHKDSANGPILGGSDAYEVMSGTSMASPQVAGMAAVAAQYIRENGLEEKTGLTARQLAQSLLMSTAEPIVDGNSGCYYPVLQQGAGLANIGSVTTADSYILMGEDATKSYADGKVKVELGDDPNLEGKYTFSFSLNNLTDKEEAFDLSADFFTQDLFLYYANGNQSMSELAFYMDTLCVSLPVNVTWTVDGKTIEPSGNVAGLDFNGDGYVNTADGQTLLDYAVGVSTEIKNAGKADLDGDGDVDTYDAYLFFKELGTGVAVVPAGGSANVTVTVELTGAWDEYLDVAENGIYVEGYIFAESQTDDEGVKGTCHSIPVLGFYGNWSDPSMYEVGTYQEYATGEEYRIPYLGKATNTYLITYANDPNSTYPFGGNPLIPDETYMPERNAINSENGDTVSKAQFTAIRNAAASRFTAANRTTDETYTEAFPGAVSSAYYYVNGGAWQQTGYTLNTKFTPKGAAEGDVLDLALTLVPEYYVDDAGNVNWDALGQGTDLAVSAVVDNTAPVLEDVSVSLTGNTMTVTASDNQYIAAVALFNKAGTTVYTAAGAKQDIQPGETAQYTMDLDGVNGKKFLLQVFDYAMNVVTFEIEMQIGEIQPIPDMIAFDTHPDFLTWVGFGKEDDGDSVTTLAKSDVVILAGCDVEGMLFASDDEGNLYVLDEEDPSDRIFVCSMGQVFTDMAYSRKDGTLYGISAGMLYAIDKLTGAVEELGKIQISTNTLACDDQGNFYSVIYGDTNAVTNRGYLYTYTREMVVNGEEPIQITQPVWIEGSDYDQSLHANNYVQSLAWNPNDGHIYWASYYNLWNWFVWGDLYEFDPATGVATALNDFGTELTALCIPMKTTGGGWSNPTNKVTGIQLSATSVNLLKGGKATLTASVLPWTATNRDVTWTSSDPTVATVDARGVVTAVAPGTATITAASVLDPTVTAECVVTVETLKTTLSGVLQDKEGTPMFFTWNLETEDTWTAGVEMDTSLTSATMNANSNKLYVMDASADAWNMHIVDPETGISETTGANAAGVPLWDMEYSKFLSTEEADVINAIYYYYLLPGKDPMALTTSAFNLQSRLSGVGAEYLVAITSAGMEYMNDNGTPVETEHVMMLDNTGNIWNYWIFPTETGGFSAWVSGAPSDLDVEFPGDSSRDNMYSSMVVGEDGAIYLSAFTGETNELYRLVYNEAAEAYEAAKVGDVGDAVWPAAIYAAELNGDVEESTAVLAPTAELELESTVAVSREDLANAANTVSHMNRLAPADAVAEDIRNAQLPSDKAFNPDSASSVEKDEKTVTVTVTA
ncbi:MAG: S8 family serine peptidase, partial [Faecousia sp.]